MCRFIETICINDGVIENLSAHNERMNNTIRVHYGSSVIPVSLEDFITAEGCKGRTRCRVEYTSAVEKVEYFPYSIREVKSLQLVGPKLCLTWQCGRCSDCPLRYADRYLNSKYRFI